MSVLYSIPIHESPECVQQMCDGILHFDKNAIIVLHASEGIDTNIFISDNPRILINTEQFFTHWGNDFTRVHISNFLYADKQCDISHIVFLTSKCLLFSDPTHQIMKYDVGFSQYGEGREKPTPPLLHTPDHMNWWVYGCTKLDSRFSDMEKYLNINTNDAYGCIVEGGFISSPIMRTICDAYIKHYGFELVGCSLEEVLLPTFGCKLASTIGQSLLLFDFYSVDYMQKLRLSEEVYFIKGVERNPDHPIRQYYNTIIYE